MPSYRYDGCVQNPVGYAMQGVDVYVCTQPANTSIVPPSPLATLFAATVSNTAALSSASWLNQLITFVFSTAPTSDVVPGSYINVSGVSPTTYNGIWQVASVSGNNVAVTAPNNPGTYVSGGSVATSALPNPVVTDGNGNFFFYAGIGAYTLMYVDPLGRIPNEVFPDQQLVSVGGGSVTSVAMTGDGVIFNTTVPGSPVTGAGTLAPTLVAQTANTVLAGPSSGGPATATWRKLVAADFSSTVGTVTSVALAATVPTIFSSSVTGSPITTSGTLTFTMTLVNQSANTFLGGPSSGASAPPTFRLHVAADIAGITPVTFSATPTFDASTFPEPTFTMTLTANVTSSTVINPTPGEHIVFMLTQGGAGSFTFAWPANFKAPTAIASAAGSVSVQEFVYDGTNWRAVAAGSSNPN